MIEASFWQRHRRGGEMLSFDFKVNNFPLGVENVFAKPLDPAALLERVAELLGEDSI